MDTQLSELAERMARVETKTDAQDVVLAQIANDVKSLLATRAFHQGVMKTIVWVSSVVATIISLTVTWLKH